jgi:hypothetical protein
MDEKIFFLFDIAQNFVSRMDTSDVLPVLNALIPCDSGIGGCALSKVRPPLFSTCGTI